MKQIPSQFVDDKEHEKLAALKAKKGWTWKQLILSTIGKQDDS